MNEKGGGHVIQTFLSLDKADEIQIRGRVARKLERGSFSLIVSWTDVKKVIRSE